MSPAPCAGARRAPTFPGQSSTRDHYLLRPPNCLWPVTPCSPLECRAMDRFRASCNGGLTDTCRIFLASSRVPAGIRRRPCLERKCRQPTAACAWRLESVFRRAQHRCSNDGGRLAKAAAQSSGCLPCGPDGEQAGHAAGDAAPGVGRFLSAVECCMLPQVGAGAGAQADGDYAATASARTNRCGRAKAAHAATAARARTARISPSSVGPASRSRRACAAHAPTRWQTATTSRKRTTTMARDRPRSTSRTSVRRVSVSPRRARPPPRASAASRPAACRRLQYPTEAPAMPPAFELGPTPP